MRFGIIGCGAASIYHVTAVNNIHNARLVGASGASEAEARTFSEKYGTRPFSSTDELLSCPDIDTVCICTPSGLHSRLAVRAAEHGKNVVIEKPIALTSESADEVILACEKNGVTGTVISQLRFSPDIQKTAAALKGNILGRLLMVNLSMKYHRSQEYYDRAAWRGTWSMDGGGALMNQGIHGIDIMLYLAGGVKSVCGYAGHIIRNIEVEDTAAASLIFNNGAFGSIVASTAVTPACGRLLEIHGEKGTIILDENRISKWYIENGGDNFELPRGAAPLFAGDASAPPPEGHEVQIAEFVDALENNREPAVTLEDGRRAVELITSVYKSSETGRTVFTRPE